MIGVSDGHWLKNYENYKKGLLEVGIKYYYLSIILIIEQ